METEVADFRGVAHLADHVRDLDAGHDLFKLPIGYCESNVEIDRIQDDRFRLMRAFEFDQFPNPDSGYYEPANCGTCQQSAIKLQKFATPPIIVPHRVEQPTRGVASTHDEEKGSWDVSNPLARRSVFYPSTIRI